MRLTCWSMSGQPATPLGRWSIRSSSMFTAHTIDFGFAEFASGVGIYFWIEDVNGDGKPDIVAPGKEGLYLFTQK